MPLAALPLSLSLSLSFGVGVCISLAEVPVASSLSASRYLIQVLMGMTHYQLGPASMRLLALHAVLHPTPYTLDLRP